MDQPETPISPPANRPNPGASDSIESVGDPFKVRQLSASGRPMRQLSQAINGRRSRALDTESGPLVRSLRPSDRIERFSDVALGATLQAAALANRQGPTLPLSAESLRRKVRAGRVPNLILFVVDGSGSMAARKRMTAVKGAILSLLIDAYQKRDRVGLITFRGERAETVLSPTNSVALANARLSKLPTGGRTPLAEGLLATADLLEQTIRRSAQPLQPLIVLLSDGRANVGPAAVERSRQAGAYLRQKKWQSVVIDCESGYPRLGLARQLAQSMGSEAVKLEELSAETLVRAVRGVGSR